MKAAIEQQQAHDARHQYAARRARRRIRPCRRARPREGLASAVCPRARLHRERSAAARCIASPARSRPSSARRPSASSSTICSRAADLAAAKNITLLIEPINAPRPAELFSQSRRARRRHHRQGRQAEHPHPVRFLSCADRRRRSDPPSREIPAGHRPSAMRRGADAPRAGRGRDQLSCRVRGGGPLGYKGWIGAEYRPRGRTEDGWAGRRPYGVVPAG